MKEKKHFSEFSWEKKVSEKYKQVIMTKVLLSSRPYECMSAQKYVRNPLSSNMKVQKKLIVAFLLNKQSFVDSSFFS
jgi:hypothetical protein